MFNRCFKDKYIVFALVADGVATVCAFVAGLGQAKTVSADDCDATYGNTFGLVFACFAAGGVLIAQLLTLRYLSKNSKTRNAALILALLPLIVAIALLFTGLKHKTKIRRDDSLLPVCAISHPYNLYIAAAFCFIHLVVLGAAVTCTAEVAIRGDTEMQRVDT